MLENQVNGRIPLHKRPEYLYKALLEKEAEITGNYPTIFRKYGSIEEMTRIVIDHLGFNDRFVDMTLKSNSPDYSKLGTGNNSCKSYGERDLFYMLENLDLINQETEEDHLLDKRLWRTHYWVWNDRKILEAVATEEADAAAQLYTELFAKT